MEGGADDGDGYPERLLRPPHGVSGRHGRRVSLETARRAPFTALHDQTGRRAGNMGNLMLSDRSSILVVRRAWLKTDRRAETRSLCS
jgi:hypothetical protein